VKQADDRTQGTATPRNLVLYGPSKTGKTAVTGALLEALSGPSRSSGRRSNGYACAPSTRLLRYAIVNSCECVTGRHLLERTVGGVADAVGFRGVLGRCENLSALGVALGRLLEGRWEGQGEGDGEDGDGDHEMDGTGGNGQTDREGRDEGTKKFVLVFDGIDRQRDAPPTLLPALARMGEIVSSFSMPLELCHFCGIERWRRRE
jgi:origin recognition complex subunit 5